MYFPGLIVWALELVNVQAGWCHTYPSVEKQGAEGMEILALSFFFFFPEMRVAIQIHS